MVWPGLTWIISLVTSSLPHSKMAIGRVRVHKRTHPVKLTVTSIRNAVAPVSRRPMEIPAYVFVYYAREYYLEDSGNPGVPQWVNVSHMQSLASCRVELSESLELLVCCVAHPIQRSTLVCVRLLLSAKLGGDASEASFNQKEVVNLRKVVSQVEVNRLAKLLPDVEHCKDCQDPTSEE